MFKVSLLHRSVIFLFPFFFSVFAFSQASNPLTTEFLEGLPPDVREELKLNKKDYLSLTAMILVN